MSSGLIILIGFGISAILMLTGWFASKNTREKKRNLAGIEKQKADIISTIEEAVNEGQKGATPQRQTSGKGGMPVWGKWFIALSMVPFVGSLVLAGMQGEGGNKSAIMQTTTTNTLTNSVGIQTTKTTISTITTYNVGTFPNGIYFDSANIWVTNRVSNNVTKLRASDGAILGTYAVGSYPGGICFDGTNIWVANNMSSNVTKIRASDGTVIGTYFVGQNPGFICFDGSNIWVACSGINGVIKLNPMDGSIVGTYGTASVGGGMCSDGTNIWVVNNDNNYVTKIRANDGIILGMYTVGQNSGGICFDGSNVWVVSGDNNYVTKIRASDGTTISTYIVGQHPDVICFDGTNIWIVCVGNNSLTELDPIDGSILGTYAVAPYTGDMIFAGTNIWVDNIVNNTVTKIPITIPLTTTTPITAVVTTSPLVHTPILTSIHITPWAPASLSVGSNQQFTAIGSYSDGSAKNINNTVNWVSSNTSIAIISSTGLATAVEAGTVYITASIDGITSPPVSLPVIATVVTKTTTTMVTTTPIVTTSPVVTTTPIVTNTSQIINYSMPGNGILGFSVWWTNNLIAGNNIRGTLSLSGSTPGGIDWSNTWNFEIDDPLGNVAFSQSYTFSSGSIKTFNFTTNQAGTWKIKVSDASDYLRTLQIIILPVGWY